VEIYQKRTHFEDFSERTVNYGYSPWGTYTVYILDIFFKNFLGKNQSKDPHNKRLFRRRIILSMQFREGKKESDPGVTPGSLFSGQLPQAISAQGPPETFFDLVQVDPRCVLAAALTDVPRLRARSGGPDRIELLQQPLIFIHAHLHPR